MVNFSEARLTTWTSSLSEATIAVASANLVSYIESEDEISEVKTL